jgi:hypothetical protein
MRRGILLAPTAHGRFQSAQGLVALGTRHAGYPGHFLLALGTL